MVSTERNIDDLKIVGLWCREHYHEYTKAVPPDETDNRTDCRWTWPPYKKEQHPW